MQTTEAVGTSTYLVPRKDLNIIFLPEILSFQKKGQPEFLLRFHLKFFKIPSLMRLFAYLVNPQKTLETVAEASRKVNLQFAWCRPPRSLAENDDQDN